MLAVKGLITIFFSFLYLGAGVIPSLYVFMDISICVYIYIYIYIYITEQ